MYRQTIRNNGGINQCIHDDGKIKLNLPSGISEAFMVIVDGEEWNDAYIDGNHVKVYFHAGAEKIEIIGNSSG